MKLRITKKRLKKAGRWNTISNIQKIDTDLGPTTKLHIVMMEAYKASMNDLMGIGRAIEHQKKQFINEVGNFLDKK